MMRSIRSGRAVASGVAVAVSLLVPLCWPAVGVADPVVRVRTGSADCRSAVAHDVNGDGYADVAVGEPGDDLDRGAVHLFYGYRGRLQTDAKGTAQSDLALTQRTKGVPGTSEKSDRFGAETLLADVNGDSCADLVVGVPGEDAGSGAVSVLYGSPRGLVTTGAQQLKSTTLLRPRPAGLDRLGATLAAGDFDGDGVTDLAATGSDPEGLPASVIVMYGSQRGLGRGRAPDHLTPVSLQLPPPQSIFGGALAAGDFDGDGDTELAVGLNSGVQVVQRRGSQLVAGTRITPDSAGFPGRRASFRSVGSALASGDVQADGFDDLVLGDPDYGMGEPESEYGKGAVVLLPGSRSGLTTARSQFWTQNSPGVQGKAEYGNQFGSALAVGRLDAGRTDDVVIGATGSGGATVLLGGDAGLSTDGVGGARYTQSTRGITGTDEVGDRFGRFVLIAQLHGNGPGSLIIAAPGEDVGSIKDAGSITQLGSSAKGPDPRHSRTLTLDSPGVRGAAGRGDGFGDALS